MCFSNLDSRQNSIMMFLKYMMDQIFCRHSLDLTMVHKFLNFYSAAAISFISCLQQITVDLITDSKSTMKVSNFFLHILSQTYCALLFPNYIYKNTGINIFHGLSYPFFHQCLQTGHETCTKQ